MLNTFCGGMTGQYNVMGGVSLLAMFACVSKGHHPAPSTILEGR